MRLEDVGRPRRVDAAVPATRVKRGARRRSRMSRSGEQRGSEGGFFRDAPQFPFRDDTAEPRRQRKREHPFADRREL